VWQTPRRSTLRITRAVYFVRPLGWGV